MCIDESTSEDESDSEEWDSENDVAPVPPDSNDDVLKVWSCRRCPRYEKVHKNMNINSSWMCRAQGKEQVFCKCGGTLEGHEKVHLADSVCWKPRTCCGRMIFSPRETSLIGGGVKATAWHLGDPELENRFEGRCVECGQLGKFNKVAERCNCSGIMVIQFDHMILERQRRGSPIAIERVSDRARRSHPY